MRKRITMTKEQEDRLLTADDTHRTVHDLLDLVREKDIVDAYTDMFIASEILKGRMDRALGRV